MYRWGHINCFRFDNGRPFGDPKRENRTALALHLIARDCQVMFNPARSPTKNAKVERCQGTTGKWSDPKNCKNLEQLRKSLEFAVWAQRERYPSRVCEKKTRMQYYPELGTNPRRYNPQDFDLNRVFRYLEKGTWYRTVSSVGQISLFGKRYQAGFKHKNKDLVIKFRIEDKKPYWLCYDKSQQVVAKLFAQNIADASYMDLSNMSKN